MKILIGKDIPSQLLEIPQPPEKLYVAGILAPDTHIPLVVVGSRKYTSYGRDICRELIAGLKGLPITIVSGLALGIDSIAHRAALDNEIHTTAFPGSGLHRSAIYPAQHLGLAEEIVASGGALVSELEPDERAASWVFPKRNRLKAGYAKAVLIIEAEEKSGTLITARLATEYNKDVLAVPGSVFSPTSRGTNGLLRLGATPIRDVLDLREALGFQEDLRDAIEDVREIPEDLSENEKRVLEILSEPLPRDEIIRALELPTHEANMILSILEIKGLVSESVGEIRRK